MQGKKQSVMVVLGTVILLLFSLSLTAQAQDSATAQPPTGGWSSGTIVIGQKAGVKVTCRHETKLDNRVFRGDAIGNVPSLDRWKDLSGGKRPSLGCAWK